MRHLARFVRMRISRAILKFKLDILEDLLMVVQSRSQRESNKSGIAEPLLVAPPRLPFFARASDHDPELLCYPRLRGPIPERVPNNSEYVPLFSRWACRKAGAWAGIHEMAIPHALNAAPAHLEGYPLGSVIFGLWPSRHCGSRGPRPFRLRSRASPRQAGHEDVPSVGRHLAHALPKAKNASCDAYSELLGTL